MMKNFVCIDFIKTQDWRQTSILAGLSGEGNSTQLPRCITSHFTLTVCPSVFKVFSLQRTSPLTEFGEMLEKSLTTVLLDVEYAAVVMVVGGAI